MKTSMQMKYSVGKSQDSLAAKKFVVSVYKQQMDLIEYFTFLHKTCHFIFV